MDERYKAYLESDWWKKTRAEYIKSVGGKCECCGKPYDLQVHHLTYEHLGYERNYELKCLCRSCHQWIEEQKKNGFLNLKNQNILLDARREKIRNPNCVLITTEQVVEQFIQYCKDNDLSSGGPLDFEKKEVIESEFSSFCINNNYPLYDVAYITRVRDSINPIRYKVILDYLSRKYPKFEVIKRTGFSASMVSKVFNNPNEYRKRINVN